MTCEKEIITYLTLSQTSPGFYVSALELFLQILWEKEKLLVTSNFSFSNSVFFPFGELSVTFITVKIVVCKSLLVGMSLKFVVWERVNPFSDMPNLGYSNSAANKDMMSKILTNADTII